VRHFSKSFFSILLKYYKIAAESTLEFYRLHQCITIYESAFSPGKCFPMSPSKIAASSFLLLVHLQCLGS